MLRAKQLPMLAGFILAVCAFCQTQALAVTYGDISAFANTSRLPAQTGHGYLQYDFAVANTSSSVTHTVTIELPGENYHFGGDVISSIRRTVAIAPGTSKTVSLWQPPVPGAGYRAAIYIDGVRQKQLLECEFGNEHASDRGWGSARAGTLLVSRETNKDTFDRAIQDTWGHDPTMTSGRMHGYGSAGGVTTAKMNYPITEWSNNWLAYSAYDSVVITAAELEQAPAEVRRALGDYVRVGGSLTVLGSWRPDASWGLVKQFDGNQRSLTQSARLANIGFGGIAVLKEGDVFGSTASAETLKNLKRHLWDKSNPPSFANSVPDANRAFAVVENMSIPVRGLFALVLLFAVVIGPANLFLLSKKKRRIYMLWTVPALSIVGSLAVVMYATFAEGWRGTSRVETVTYFDQSAKRASTIGIAAFYSPMTPGDGLHWDYETEVTQLALSGRYDGGRSRTVDWTNDQHFKSGWIAARVPAHFQVRKAQSSALRVVFEEKEGKILAGNSLGGDIKKLWYADQAGDVYVAEDIAAGQNAVLKRDPNMSTASMKMDSIRDLHTSNWTVAAGRVTSDPDRYLKPDSYVAVLKEPVFVEPQLANLKKSKHLAVIIGDLKEVANGS